MGDHRRGFDRVLTKGLGFEARIQWGRDSAKANRTKLLTCRDAVSSRCTQHRPTCSYRTAPSPRHRIGPYADGMRDMLDVLDVIWASESGDLWVLGNQESGSVLMFRY